MSANIWHRHLGHASLPVIDKSISLAHQNKNSSVYSECQLAKSHVMTFKHVHVSILKLLELIYSNVWGGRLMFYLPLVHVTKYLWLFPLKLKSNAYQTFICF